MRFRSIVSAFSFATLCAPAFVHFAHAQAPAAPSKPTIEKPAAKPDAILAGEIRLDGRIMAITGVNGFDISAISFTSQAGKRFEFEESKPKTIVGDAKTLVVAGDDLERPVQWKEVKLGMRVAIVGRDGGAKGFRARLIILTDYSAKYVKGSSVRMSRAVSILVGRGETLLNAQDYEGSTKFFKQAATVGSGIGDVSGAAASLGWLGNAYSEMNQQDNAETAYRQALKLGETAPNDSGLGTLYNNMGMLLLKTERAAEAVKMLEKSNALKDGEPEESAVLTTRNLARAYLANKQADKAISLWRSVLPILLARREPDQAALVQLGIAAAQNQLKNSAGAEAALTEAREHIEKTTDPLKKAAALASLGSNRAAANDKEGARTAWNSAIELFSGANDSRSAARLRSELEKLDAPATPETPAPVAPPTTPAEAA